MDRKIIFEVQDLGIKFAATMLDKEEPEMCDAFWKRLKEPLKMYCRHTLSTGERFLCEPRPPRHPVKSGSQYKPIGRKQFMLCELEPGTIIYTGRRLEFAYGNNITEPAPSGGTVIAVVDKENIDDLIKLGKAIWNSMYMTHKLLIIEAKREEN